MNRDALLGHAACKAHKITLYQDNTKIRNTARLLVLNLASMVVNGVLPAGIHELLHWCSRAGQQACFSELPNHSGRV